MQDGHRVSNRLAVCRQSPQSVQFVCRGRSQFQNCLGGLTALLRSLTGRWMLLDCMLFISIPSLEGLISLQCNIVADCILEVRLI
jgi:hypothetical protein